MSLLPLVDGKGVAWASTLLYHTRNHAWCFTNVSSSFGKSLEQKWKYCFYCRNSRAPQQDGPQPPKGVLCWGCLISGLACIARGEPWMCFPADTDRSWAWCYRARGSLLDPILMSNCDYTRAPEPVLVTCGPSSKGGSACLWYHWKICYPFMKNACQDNQRQW